MQQYSNEWHSSSPPERVRAPACNHAANANSKLTLVRRHAKDGYLMIILHSLCCAREKAGKELDGSG